MKKFILPVLLLLCFSTKTKSQLIADPALEQVIFTDLSGTPIDDTMPLGYIARLNVPVRNLNVQNGIPAGTCKLKIGLGSKMNLAPGFNLSQTNTSNYFNWIIENTGGQWQLTGDLIATIPPGYNDTARFNVQGIVLGYSTITANFLVTNHNTTVIASDENPGNNSSFRLYKIIPADPIPVRFTGLSAVNRNCQLIIRFTVENEWNLSHYDVEFSNDGRNFSRAGQLEASRRNAYEQHLDVPDRFAVPLLHIRIKSVDADGSFRYSETVQVNAQCQSPGVIHLYPNPVQGETAVFISLPAELNGKRLRLELFDLVGRTLSIHQQTPGGTSPIRVPVNGLAAGSYQMRISDNDSFITVLQFVKQ